MLIHVLGINRGVGVWPESHRPQVVCTSEFLKIKTDGEGNK